MNQKRNLSRLAVIALLLAFSGMTAWANGSSWETALQIAQMEEGIFSSLILRIADNLRHIRNLQDIFPQPGASASAAIDLILRDPVLLY